LIEDTAPPPPPPPPPLVVPRVGILVPLSGRYASYGQAYLHGATLATEEFEARGPRRVEIVPADCKEEPLATLAATRRLIGTERLVAIVGSLMRVPTLVAALESNCNGVSLCSNLAAEDGLQDIGPYVFQSAPPRAAAARAAAELAVFELRRFRAAVVAPEDGEGATLAAAFAARLQELGGELVFSKSFAAGTTDFTPVVRPLAASHPEVVYTSAAAEDLQLLVPALAFLALDATLIGTEDLGVERVVRACGDDLEGAILPAPVRELESAEMERLRARYQERYKSAPNRYAIAGFTGTRRVLDAIARTLDADRDAVRAALAGARPNAGAQTPLVGRFQSIRGGELRALTLP
jgi:branched-chain amino acid transport system substrate-binding protein